MNQIKNQKESILMAEKEIRNIVEELNKKLVESMGKEEAKDEIYDLLFDIVYEYV